MNDLSRDGEADAVVPAHGVGPPSPQQFPASALYMVATPIGNLGDMTSRALECLRAMDAVAAEDTRNTRRLLQHYGISTPCFAVHQHNEREGAGRIVDQLRRGQRIAYVSDAGTPAISDPGARLVSAVQEASLRVIPIPGASAAVAVLSAAGLKHDQFCFLGFLPARRGEAARQLESAAALTLNVVLYEAPHRILETVAWIAGLFADQARELVIAREVTKLFETIVRLPLQEAEAWLRADENRQRGEFVLVLGPRPTADQDERDLEAAMPLLTRLAAVLPLRQAVDITAETSGAPRKALYNRALALKRTTQDP